MDGPIATIKQGQLRGCIRTDIGGGQIVSFLGVPYAKPPIGELRFKAPEPAEPWEGVMDATVEGNNCYARDLFFGDVDGSEDCLNLNIFTKSLPDEDKQVLPVMVWIHGGAFVTGSNKMEMYGPEFLLTEDMVLVTINYRLGALGFLSIKDESLGVPGNAGLKDQTMALRWVQENISAFSGDPENVTIFGQSAGSASVHYQMLSPTAKGLFHKAILQSGCALNYWALGQPAAKELAMQIGHQVRDEKEALDVLMKAPVEEIYAAQEKIDLLRKPSRQNLFVPVIEKPNETAFITENPIDIIRSGNYNKVPMIVGFTTREGLLLSIYDVFASMSGMPPKKDPANLEDQIPWQIGLERGSEVSQQICQNFRKVYFKGPNPADDACVASAEGTPLHLATDSIFVAGIMAAVKNHLETLMNPIYLYRMSLDAELNAVKKIVKLTVPGACHGDELGYLFKNTIMPPRQLGNVEAVSVTRFVKLWTNFAKYGTPTPDSKDVGIIWEPVEQENINFIDIGEEIIPGVNPEADRMELWREIYKLNPETACFL